MGNVYNLVIQTVVGAPGTATTINLGSAATINGSTYLTFALANTPNGAPVEFSIIDPVNGGVEQSTAIYNSSGPSLTGRTVIASSNSNSPINASSSSLIRCTPSATYLTNATGLPEFTNRLINPSGKIWQRANSGSAAITDGTYAFDRWYGLTETAGVTAAQGANAANGIPYYMYLYQQQTTAQHMGIAQVIESANCIDLRGKTVTLSGLVGPGTSGTTCYAILEWTGTVDTVTKDVVNNWTSTTYTPGNFFIASGITVAAVGSSTGGFAQSINLSATISSSANNLIVFVWSQSAVAQTTTLILANMQLEAGPSATPLAMRSFQQEQALCDRYFQAYGGQWLMQNPAGTTRCGGGWRVPLRASPSITGLAGNGWTVDYAGWTVVYSATSASITTVNAEL